MYWKVSVSSWVSRSVFVLYVPFCVISQEAKALNNTNQSQTYKKFITQ